VQHDDGRAPYGAARAVVSQCTIVSKCFVSCAVWEIKVAHAPLRASKSACVYLRCFGGSGLLGFCRNPALHIVFVFSFACLGLPRSCGRGSRLRLLGAMSKRKQYEG
jgi:hypothetical protein